MIETNFKHTDWIPVNLGQLCTVWGRIGFRGYTKADLVRKGEGAITFSPSDIHDQKIDYSDCDYISLRKYEESPEIKVFNGDIIFCKTASIGKCAIIENLTEKATINPQFVVLKDFKCSNYFLYYKLIEKAFQTQVLSITGGSTIPTMSQEKLKEMQFFFPPTLAEQERIADALSKIDSLIVGLDELLEKKRAIKSGTMQQLLTGKKRLKGFTGEWDEVELGEVLDYEQPTKYIVSSTEYTTDGIPVLTAGKTFILGYTHEDKGIYDNTPVIIFDDFVTESKYVDFPFKVKSSAIKMLQLKDKSNNLRLVYEMMKMIDFPVADHKRWWISQYSKNVIKLPKPAEQNAIASILSSMDTEIASLEQKRDKYIAIKQGMMQQLLTGKIRLV